MPIVINCPLSGTSLRLGTLSSNLNLPGISPLANLPLTSYEKILAAECPTDWRDSHAILCGLLVHCKCLFSSSLPAMAPSFYTMELPRFLKLAQSLSRMHLPFPHFRITSATGRDCLLAWVSECEEVLANWNLRRIQESPQQQDVELEALIQYIWHTPAIRARKDWLKAKLISAPPLSAESCIQVCCNPFTYPLAALLHQKKFILEWLEIANQHDGYMLQSLFQSLDKAIIRNANTEALINHNCVALDEDQLRILELTTHKENNEALSQLKQSLAHAAANSATLKQDELTQAQQPKPQQKDYSNKIKYQLALAKWEALQSITGN